MAKHTTPPITSDGQTESINLKNTPRGSGNSAEKSIYADGDIGGGSAALEQSLDGTNWFAVKDAGGTAITFSGRDGVLVTMPSDSLNPVRLRLDLTGSTTPSLSLTVFDTA